MILKRLKKNFDKIFIYFFLFKDKIIIANHYRTKSLPFTRSQIIKAIFFQQNSLPCTCRIDPRTLLSRVLHLISIAAFEPVDKTQMLSAQEPRQAEKLFTPLAYN